MKFTILNNLLNLIKMAANKKVEIVKTLTSFPCFCRNSISCCVNVVMEIDFTLCGGFNPRLREKIFYTFTIIYYNFKITHQCKTFLASTFKLGTMVLFHKIKVSLKIILNY